MSVLSSVASKWLMVHAPSVLAEVVPGANSRREEVVVRDVLSTGHRQKLMVDVEQQRFVCQLSLTGGYCEVLSQLHSMCQTNGIPVAPVYSSGQLIRWLTPVHYMVLGWLPGEPCNKERPLSLDHLRELGRIIGALHSIRASTSERVEVAGKARADFDRTILARLHRSIRELADVPELSKGGLPDAASKWLDEFKDLLVSSDYPLTLTHGDLHGNNILIDGDQLHLIDTDQMQFGLAPLELMRCLVADYCKADRDRQCSFYWGYEEKIDPTVFGLLKSHVRPIAGAMFLILAREKLAQSRQALSARKQMARFRQAIIFSHSFTRIFAPTDGPIDVEGVLETFREVHAETMEKVNLGASRTEEPTSIGLRSRIGVAWL